MFAAIVESGRRLAARLESQRSIYNVPADQRLFTSELTAWSKATTSLVHDAFGDESPEYERWRQLQTRQADRSAAQLERDAWNEVESALTSISECIGLLGEFQLLLDAKPTALSDDELELKILKRYVEQHRAASIADPDGKDKCSRELDMREVLREVTVGTTPRLEYAARLWFTRLVRCRPGDCPGPLRACSDSPKRDGPHKYHARAFMDADRAPAWDRVRDLQTIVGRSVMPSKERELEQKFRILWSSGQATLDFDDWTSRAQRRDVSVAVLFVDTDNFKGLNSAFTETRVDQTILPDLQRLLERQVRHRGYAYRQGGEEFVVLLPNHTQDEAVSFAERLRVDVANHAFSVDAQAVQLTVSIGIAVFPDHGSEFRSVLQAANDAEKQAKQTGRNRVVVRTNTPPPKKLSPRGPRRSRG